MMYTELYQESVTWVMNRTVSH